MLTEVINVILTVAMEKEEKSSSFCEELRRRELFILVAASAGRSLGFVDWASSCMVKIN